MKQRKKTINKENKLGRYNEPINTNQRNKALMEYAWQDEASTY